MLLIPCPYCGPRDETEFTYGGPAHITRPELTASDREWTHYLYHRENTKGPYRERWLHAFGCGCWFNVQRDTTTHEILEVYLMGQSAPSTSGIGSDLDSTLLIEATAPGPASASTVSGPSNESSR